MVICRKAFGMEHIITLRHFENMAKIMLVTGSMVGYAYGSSSSSPGTAATRTSSSPSSTAPSAPTPGPTGSWSAATCSRRRSSGSRRRARNMVDAVRRVDLRQHRHVVRALRDRRLVAAPRLPALELGLLHADLLGRDPRSSAASACSSRCSACSCASCRSSPRPRSRRAARRPTRIHGEPSGRSSHPGRVAKGEPGRGLLMPPLIPTLPGGHRALRRAGPLRRAPRRSTTPASRCATPATRPLGRPHAVPGSRTRPRDGPAALALPWIVLGRVCPARRGHAAAVVGRVQAYPLVISGKPLFSWPAFVPVTFELGVLFGGRGVPSSACSRSTSCRCTTTRCSAPSSSSASATTRSSSRSNPGIPKFDPQAYPDFLNEQIGAEHVELIDQ